MQNSNEPIFIIQIILKLFKIINPIIKFFCWILCLPHVFVLTFFSHKNLNEYKYHNIFQLSFLLIIKAVQALITLNIHLLIIFMIINGTTQYLQISIVFILVNTLMKPVYRVCEIKNRETVFSELLILVLVHIMWILIVLSFTISLFSSNYWELIKYPLIIDDLRFSNVIYHGFYKFFYSLAGLIQRILIIFHVVNPISSFRMYFILKNMTFYELEVNVWISFYHIFIHDSLLLSAYLINWIFPIKTLKVHASFKYSHQNGYTDDILPYDIFNFQPYKYLKYKVIRESFFIYFRYLPSLIISIINIPNIIFFWRIRKTVQIFKEFNKICIKLHFLNIIINFLDGLIEFLSLFAIIITCISPFHFLCLLKYRKICKEKNEKIRFGYASVLIFVEKNFDILFSLIDLIKLLTPTQYLYIIHSRSLKSIFPLLIENDNFFYKQNKDTVLSLKELFESFWKRRLNQISKLCIRLCETLGIILNIPCLIDFFSGMRMIKLAIIILKLSFNCQNIEFEEISHKIIRKTFSNITTLYVNLLFFYPICLIVAIFTPWNDFFIIKHSLKNNFLYEIEKIRKIDIYINKPSTKIFSNNKSFKKNNDFFFGYLIPKAWFEFTFIIKFLILHVTMIRIIIIWKQFKQILRKDISEEIKENTKNNKIKNYSYEENLLLNKLINKTKDLDKWSMFSVIILDNFVILLREIALLPLFIVLCILSPWNIYIFIRFLYSELLISKLRYLGKMLKVTFLDFITIILCVILLLSVIKTASVLRLLYYTLRMKLNSNQEISSIYHIHYKGKLRHDLINMIKLLYNMIIIIVLFILNMILITNIPSTIRRTNRFFKREVNKDIYIISKIINSYAKKKDNEFISHMKFQSLSTNDICCLTEFLTPKDLFRLTLTNRSLHLKLNANLIWKNQYENYFKKVLLKYGRNEVLSSITEEDITSYKSLCKTLSKNSVTKVFTEEERDKLVGLKFVLIEEIVMSLIRFPHLLFIPFKILGLIYVLWEKFINIVLLIIPNTIYQNYLKGSFYYENHLNLLLNSFKEKEPADNLYYNLQIYLVCTVYELVLFVILTIQGLFIFLFSSLIKIISIQPLINSLNENTLQQKKANLSRLQIIHQTIIGFVIGFTLYYYLYVAYGTNINELLLKLSDPKEKFINLPSLLLVFEMTINLVFICLTKFFHASWSAIFFFTFGKIFAWIVLYLIADFLIYSLKRSNVIVGEILIEFIFPVDRLIKIIVFLLDNLLYYFLGIFILTLFPFHHIGGYLYRNYYVRGNIIIALLFNLLILIFMVLPFYLNFKVSLTFFRFVTINLYGIINLILISKELKI